MQFTIKHIAILLSAGFILYKIVEPKGKVLVFNGKKPGPLQKFHVERVDHIHQGIDITARSGNRIYAPKDGIVAAIWPDGLVKNYGNTIVIQHDSNEQTLYGHMSKFNPAIKRGSFVKQGTIIGFVGNTQKPREPGASHVHFEVIPDHTLKINRDLVRLEPEKWLKKNNVMVG